MPRSGDTYSLPAGTIIANGATSDAPTQHNAPFNDIAADLNLARPVSTGGTGATTAAAARTNLGLALGTDVQAYDADLAAIAALTSAADKFPYSTGAAAWALGDLTATARSLLDDTSVTAMKITLALGTVYATAGGTTAYTFTASGPALATGEVWRVRVNATATGSVTLNRDSLGAKSVMVYSAGVAKVAAAAADWVIGCEYVVAYDGTDYVILGERNRRGTAAYNIVQLDSAGALPAVSGAALTAFPTAGFTSSDQTITSGTQVALTHSLGSAPSFVKYELVCQTAEAGYSIGHIIPANLNSSTAGTSRANKAVENGTSNTQILFRFSADANCFVTADNSGNSQLLTNANWKLRVRAWK